MTHPPRTRPHPHRTAGPFPYERPRRPRGRGARLAAVVGGIAASLAGACADGPTAPADPRSEPALARSVDSATRALGVPGAVVLVRRADGSTLTVTAGVADRRTRRPMDPQDRFRVASVTKPMVATVVLQLVDEGRVALDAPVGAYLPDVVPGADRVTVRQLLDHSAGLPNYTAEPAFVGTLASDPGRVWTPQQLLAVVRNVPPTFAPGAGYAYSNTNYVVLGLLVERVTGRPVGDELRSRVFDRVGMPNTVYSTTPSLPAPFAQGYVDFGFVRDTAVGTLLHPSGAGAAGAVVSTAADLARFVEALAAGTLVSPASAAAQRTAVAASPIGYGLGVVVGGGWIGHDGAIPGYESEAYARTAGVGTVVVLVNKLTGRGAARALFRVVRDAQFAP